MIGKAGARSSFAAFPANCFCSSTVPFGNTVGSGNFSSRNSAIFQESVTKIGGDPSSGLNWMEGHVYASSPRSFFPEGGIPSSRNSGFISR
jgi:hypothetical protein